MVFAQDEPGRAARQRRDAEGRPGRIPSRPLGASRSLHEPEADPSESPL